MHRFWNLKTQFMAVMVFLLLGALLLQNYVQDRNEDRLLAKFQHTAQEIADEITQSVAVQLASSSSIAKTQRLPGGAAPLRGRAGNVIVLDIGEVEAGYSAKTRRIDAALHVVTDLVNRNFERSVPADLVHLEFRSSPVLETNDAAADPQSLSPADWEGLISAYVAKHAGSEGETPRGRAGEWPVVGLTPVSPQPQDGRTRRPRASGASAPSQLVWVDDGTARLDISHHIDGIRMLFDEYRRIDLVATVGIFLCGIAAALYLGFRITRPVYSVVDAFDRVSEGDLETRVETTGSSEFAALGEQFNRMVVSLRENRELEKELVQRERVQHMGDLAAGIAHDVRNPLNAIHLNIGQIRDEFLPDEPESRRRFLRFTSDVQSEVERLNRLVGNFLSLAQPSATSTEPVAPAELIEELRRLIQKEAVERGVELRVSTEPDLPSYTWDRQEMKSAFLNVAMNALQAMEPDGGEFRIECASVPGEPDRLRVTFTDTGRGIDAEALEKIFIPYFTTRSGGTGLGMSIARKIAERNGGRIEVTSRVGEGTRVQFLFTR